MSNKKAKKVVAVIVEGPSDESAIGGILSEYFESDDVQFAVVHGDITSDNKTSVNNVVSKITNLINGIRSKYGYNWDDFEQIIHIADTDGAFTKNCIREADVRSICYHEEYMEASDVEAVKIRNNHKSEIMYKLCSTGKVHNIRYTIYYNSCNLEHVLYNELKDFSDLEKEELADDFADRYDGNVEEFIDFISDNAVAVIGTYKETWKYIQQGTNSLHRHSNMHLIFK